MCASQEMASVLQGFLVNRVLIPMINEAFYCLMEVGVARGGASCC
jgi:3-hydroxyacyl-CoA dehydrogenase